MTGCLQIVKKPTLKLLVFIINHIEKLVKSIHFCGGGGSGTCLESEIIDSHSQVLDKQVLYFDLLLVQHS